MPLDVSKTSFKKCNWTACFENPKLIFFFHVGQTQKEQHQ
jgi:hypothetical protein